MNNTETQNRTKEIKNFFVNDLTSILNPQFNTARKIYIDDCWRDSIMPGIYSEEEIMYALEELAFEQVKPTIKKLIVRTAIQKQSGAWVDFGDVYKFSRK